MDTPHSAESVTVVGATAYVADGYSGLQVIDISNPAFPTVIGSVNTLGYAQNVTVIDSKAYVADEYSGLQVIDLSNPAAPTIIGAVETPCKANNVTVIGSTAYVADGKEGLQVIDISISEAPTIIGSVGTQGYANDVAVVGGTVIVAGSSKGLQIIPIPVEITPVDLISDTHITATLPSPPIAGNYNIRVFNGDQSDELVGAVTFSDKLANSKAIIVVGSDSKNSLSEEFQRNATTPFVP